MADRKTLRAEHLNDFRAWLDSRNIDHRHGQGDYQVMQVKVGSIWAAVYKRAGADHLTVEQGLITMVSAFMYERRRESQERQDQLREMRESLNVKGVRKTVHAVGELRSAVNQLGDAKAGILKACELFRAAGIDHKRSTMAAQKLADAVAILNREIQFFNQTGGNHD